MTARSNIQENLAYAIRFGTNEQVYFGKSATKSYFKSTKFDY